MNAAIQPPPPYVTELQCDEKRRQECEPKGQTRANMLGPVATGMCVSVEELLMDGGECFPS